MVKISNDRRSGERRSARLEWRTSRGEKGGRNTIRVLNPANRKRHGQLRRLRQRRSRGEMNRGADRTIVVRITDWVLRGRRSAGLPSRGGNNRSVPDAPEMDVSERQGDLNCQREQRESRASP